MKQWQVLKPYFPDIIRKIFEFMDFQGVGTQLTIGLMSVRYSHGRL